MNTRRYQTAYWIAKSVEIISWLILIGGIISGIALIPKTNLAIGVVVTITSVVFGLLLIFSAQLTLIFIDTENNTRQAMNELIKTNAMLAETLGTIAVSVNRLAEKEED